MKRKTLLLLLIMAIVSNYAIAQNAKTKQQIKQEKKEKALKEWHELKKSIEDREYVFKINYVEGITIDPAINFLYVKDSIMVLQIANGIGGGANGIGGITADCKIATYNVKTKKEGKAIIVEIIANAKLGQGLRRGPVKLVLTAYSYEVAYGKLDSHIELLKGELKKLDDAKIFMGNRLN